ncbi:MAG: hypothetical protein AABY22_03465 [Nanoarchaeota archaeon]
MKKEIEVFGNEIKEELGTDDLFNHFNNLYKNTNQIFDPLRILDKEKIDCLPEYKKLYISEEITNLIATSIKTLEAMGFSPVQLFKKHCERKLNNYNSNEAKQIIKEKDIPLQSTVEHIQYIHEDTQAQIQNHIIAEAMAISVMKEKE